MSTQVGDIIAKGALRIPPEVTAVRDSYGDFARRGLDGFWLCEDESYCPAHRESSILLLGPLTVIVVADPSAGGEHR